jgi:hypothetical protein
VDIHVTLFRTIFAMNGMRGLFRLVALTLGAFQPICVSLFGEPIKCLRTAEMTLAANLDTNNKQLHFTPIINYSRTPHNPQAAQGVIMGLERYAKPHQVVTLWVMVPEDCISTCSCTVHCVCKVCRGHATHPWATGPETLASFQGFRVIQRPSVIGISGSICLLVIGRR